MCVEGIWIICIEEFFKCGIFDVMVEVCEIVGVGEIYVSYDIDFIDLIFVPGMGMLEVGGFNSFEVL